MDNVSDIINELGGNSAVARELGLKPSAVSEMRRRGSIPAKYWHGFIRLAAAKDVRGVDADRLIAIHAADAPEGVAV